MQRLLEFDHRNLWREKPQRLAALVVAGWIIGDVLAQYVEGRLIGVFNLNLPSIFLIPFVLGLLRRNIYAYKALLVIGIATVAASCWTLQIFVFDQPLGIANARRPHYLARTLSNLFWALLTIWAVLRIKKEEAFRFWTRTTSLVSGTGVLLFAALLLYTLFGHSSHMSKAMIEKRYHEQIMYLRDRASAGNFTCREKTEHEMNLFDEHPEILHASLKKPTEKGHISYTPSHKQYSRATQWGNHGTMTMADGMVHSFSRYQTYIKSRDGEWVELTLDIEDIARSEPTLY